MSAPVIDIDLPTADFFFFREAWDGPGWYYLDSEYPEEGACGAFAALDDAVEHAVESGEYAIGRISGPILPHKFGLLPAGGAR